MSRLLMLHLMYLRVTQLGLLVRLGNFNQQQYQMILSFTQLCYRTWNENLKLVSRVTLLQFKFLKITSSKKNNYSRSYKKSNFHCKLVPWCSKPRSTSTYSYGQVSLIVFEQWYSTISTKKIIKQSKKYKMINSVMCKVWTSRERYN